MADEHSITLKDLMSWIQRTLLELESALDNLKSNSSPEGFTSISEKRLDPTGRLSGFVERLQRYLSDPLLGGASDSLLSYNGSNIFPNFCCVENNKCLSNAQNLISCGAQNVDLLDWMSFIHECE